MRCRFKCFVVSRNDANAVILICVSSRFSSAGRQRKWFEMTGKYDKFNDWILCLLSKSPHCLLHNISVGWRDIMLFYYQSIFAIVRMKKILRNIKIDNNICGPWSSMTFTRSTPAIRCWTTPNTHARFKFYHYQPSLSDRTEFDQNFNGCTMRVLTVVGSGDSTRFEWKVKLECDRIQI